MKCKRLLSIILCLVMIISMLPFGNVFAMAAEEMTVIDDAAFLEGVQPSGDDMTMEEHTEPSDDIMLQESAQPAGDETELQKNSEAAENDTEFFEETESADDNTELQEDSQSDGDDDAPGEGPQSESDNTELLQETDLAGYDIDLQDDLMPVDEPEEIREPYYKDFSGWIEEAEMLYKDGEVWKEISDNDSTVITTETPVRMRFSYKIPDELLPIINGDQIFIVIPGAFFADKVLDGVVTSPLDGSRIGSYSVTDSLVVITFNRAVISGTIQLEGTLAESDGTNGSDDKTHVQVGEFSWDIKVNPPPAVWDYSLSKAVSNIISKNSDGVVVEYRIRVNNKANTTPIKDLEITDTFISGGEYFKYYVANSANFSFSPVQEEVGTLSMTISDDGKTATFHYSGEIPADTNFNITYQVVLNMDAFYAQTGGVITDIINQAIGPGPDSGNLPSAKKPIKTTNKPVNKSWTVEDGKYKYIIEVNKDGFINVGNGDEWIIEDNLKDQTIVGDITIYGWHQNNSELSGYPIKLTEFNGKSSFKWQVPKGNYYYRIEYYAIPDSGVNTNEDILYNTAQLKKGDVGFFEDTIGIPPGTELYDIEKTLTNVVYKDHLMSWEVELSNPSFRDGDSIIPKDATYTDSTGASAGVNYHKFTDETINLKIVDKEGRTLIEGEDYELTITEPEQESSTRAFKNRFIVKFLENQKAPVKLYYSSEASFDNLETDLRYTNNCVLTVGGRSVSDGETFRTGIINIDKEAGGYDIESNQFQWTIDINSNTRVLDFSFGDITITDQIPEGLEYIPESLEILRYNNNQWETLTEGSGKDYAASYDETTRVLTVNFPVKIINEHDVQIYYKTSVISKDEKAKFTNSAQATWLDNELSSAQATAEMKGPISKDGIYSEDTAPYIEYTLEINPTGTVYGGDKNIPITLTDTLQGNVEYPISFKVYDLSGPSRRELIMDQDYTVEQRGKGFVMSLPNGKPLRVEYSCFVNGTIGSEATVSNSATISIVGASYGSSSFGGTFIVMRGKATGNVPGLSIFVNKRNGHTEDYIPGSWFVFGEAVVKEDSNGKIYAEKGSVIKEFDPYNEVDPSVGTEFTEADDGLAYGKLYYLEEETAPDGYIKSNYITFFVIQDRESPATALEDAILQGNYVENDNESYEVVASGKAFIFNNYKSRLVITKTVTGDNLPADWDSKEFTVTVAGPANVSWDGVRISKDGRLLSDQEINIAGNKITLTVKHESNVVISRLPIGTYTVTEEGAAADEPRFETTLVIDGSVSDDGIVELDDRLGSSVELTNDYSTGPLGNLTVSKTVVGTDADKSQYFTFTVTLDDESINGTYGDMNFTGGKFTFKLKDGESRTALNLPADTGYTVTESDNDGYTVTATNEKGSIKEDETIRVRFENRKGDAGEPPTEEPDDKIEPDIPITPKSTDPPQPTSANIPDTSDESRPVLWALFMALSFMGMVAVVFLDKRSSSKAKSSKKTE